ncbi:MAG: CPBP family intramembrane glutamic endopeptidase [Flavobacteriales bacterium]|jgi:membrane protease YdiL (CAAX protease family)
MKPPQQLIMRLALATLAGMPLVAIVIDRYTEKVDLAAMLVGYSPWYSQLAGGAAVGIAAGFAARWLISRPFMDPVNRRYVKLLGQFDLTMSEILFISFCAGVGEEMLFRGALQPFLGVILTAVVFVAIHGYLNPRDWRISTYGLMMTGFIMVIGFMAEWLGLASAMLAHTLIDVILLHDLQATNGSRPLREGWPQSEHEHEQEE